MKDLGHQLISPKTMKGPNAAFPSIDHFVSECKPESWKNIPVPLVEAMQLLTECLSDIKKSIHANYNENCQIGRLVNISTLNAKRDARAIREDLLKEFDLREMDNALLFEKQAQVCREREQQVYKELETQLKRFVEEKSISAMEQTKDWMTKLTSELVQTSSNTQREYISKHLKKLKNRFNVEGLIGPFDTLMRSQGKTASQFPDYQSFMRYIYKVSLSFKSCNDTASQSIKELQSSFSEL